MYMLLGLSAKFSILFFSAVSSVLKYFRILKISHYNMYGIKNFHVLADWVIGQVLHAFLVLSLQFHHFTENTFSKTHARTMILVIRLLYVNRKKSQTRVDRKSMNAYKSMGMNKRNLLTTWRQRHRMKVLQRQNTNK